MLNKLSTSILKRQIDKYLQQTARKKAFLNFVDVHTVLLLFEVDETDNDTDIRKMIATLKHENKTVKAYVYTKFKDTVLQTNEDYIVLHKKDFNCFHKPNKQLIASLTAQSYDIVMDLSIQSTIAINYLLLYAQAIFKTGLKKSDLNLYDFAIDLDSYLEENETNIKQLGSSFIFEQLIFYMKNIHSKD